MANYSMAQVAALTGINAHTLRKWESRYSFVTPERTDTNIRFYTDALLRKLLNVSILQQNGLKLAKIDNMSTEEIQATVYDMLLNPTEGNEFAALTLSAIELDERKFSSILNEKINDKGLLAVVLEIIYPFLNQIGVLWCVHKVMPSQEHFVSNLVRQKIIAATDALPMPLADASKIIMFLPEDEHHEIGLLLAQYIAKKLGWDVCYLGQNVPMIDLEAVHKIVNPNFLLTMFVTTIPNEVTDKIAKILDYTSSKLIISGNPINLEQQHFTDRTVYIDKPEGFVSLLKDYS